MTHLAMTAASWPVTWVLFGLVAWCGAALILIWAMSRLFRWQNRGAVPYTITPKGDDELGFGEVRAILDGSRVTLTDQEWDVLLDMEKRFMG